MLAEGLSPKQSGNLVERFGSLMKAALAAMAKPGYGDELRGLGAQVYSKVGGESFVHFPAHCPAGMPR
jgi:hypothetical protein